ncbi:MAG: hypothetical protein QXK69_11875 [Candidatus Caldarchaeum sp.]
MRKAVNSSAQLQTLQKRLEEQKQLRTQLEINKIRLDSIDERIQETLSTFSRVTGKAADVSNIADLYKTHLQQLHQEKTDINS